MLNPWTTFIDVFVDLVWHGVYMSDIDYKARSLKEGRYEGEKQNDDAVLNSVVKLEQYAIQIHKDREHNETCHVAEQSEI